MEYLVYKSRYFRDGLIPIPEFLPRRKDMEWSTSATQFTVFVLLTVVTVDTIRRIIRNRIESKGYPFPPGPTPLQLLGSALSPDIKSPWLTFTEWGAKYGECSASRQCVP